MQVATPADLRLTATETTLCQEGLHVQLVARSRHNYTVRGSIVYYVVQYKQPSFVTMLLPRCLAQSAPCCTRRVCIQNSAVFAVITGPLASIQEGPANLQRLAVVIAPTYRHMHCTMHAGMRACILGSTSGIDMWLVP